MARKESRRKAAAIGGPSTEGTAVRPADTDEPSDICGPNQGESRNSSPPQEKRQPPGKQGF